MLILIIVVIIILFIINQRKETFCPTQGNYILDRRWKKHFGRKLNYGNLKNFRSKVLIDMLPDYDCYPDNQGTFTSSKGCCQNTF